MSNVSTAHDVIPFISGKTNPLTDQRLCRVMYKDTKKSPAAHPSVAVSLPMIAHDDITTYGEQLIPFIKSMLESAQDRLVKNLYEESEGKLTAVTDGDVSIPALISFMEAESVGDRLKKDHIETWFDRVCADNVFVLVAEKLGFTDPNADQEAVILKHVKTYRDILSMLAGGKTILTPQQIKGCKVVINASSDESGIGEKLITRLERMESAKIVDVLEL